MFANACLIDLAVQEFFFQALKVGQVRLRSALVSAVYRKVRTLRSAQK